MEQELPLPGGPAGGGILTCALQAGSVTPELGVLQEQDYSKAEGAAESCVA